MIRIKNLSKSFGPKRLFDDLNLSIPQGQVFALIGPNGAGKTTLMRMLLGWEKWDQGDVQIREGVTLAYSPESPHFPEILTGRQTLDYFMEVRKIPKALRMQESRRLMEAVGLPLDRDTKVAAYSKGMRQRLALAQALIGDPDILLLDEPSAGLDFFGQIQIQGLIQSLRNRNKTILLNSHLLHDVARVADAGYLFMGPDHGRTFSRQDLSHQTLADLFMAMAKEADYASPC